MKSLIDLFHQYKSKPSQATLIALLESYQATIYAVCFQVLEHGQDAEDAAQEVLIEIVQGIQRISDPLHFKRWVCRVAYNNALDLRRKRIRCAQHLERFAEEKDKEIKMQSSPHFKEIQEVIHEHIAQLDNDSRMLMVEHHFEKRTLEEIAEERGVSTSAIWQKIQKTHETLKRSMAEAGYASLSVGIVPFLESLQPATISHSLITPAIFGKMTAATVSGTAASTLTIGGILMTTKTVTAIATLGILATGVLVYEFLQAPENRQKPVTVQAQPTKATKDIVKSKPVKTKIVSASVTGSASSVKAQEIADRIRKADDGVGMETMSKWINQLVALLEDDAIPVIEGLLRSQKNFRYQNWIEPARRYGIYPTLRVGLLNVLRQIGNPRAKEVGLSSLPEAQDYLEIFEISQIIMQHEESVTPYRNEFLAAIKHQLDREKEWLSKEEESQRKMITEIAAEGGEPPVSIFLSGMDPTEPLYIYGFEYGMISHLEGVEELRNEIAEVCSYGINGRNGLVFLATSLEPATALETLQRAYEMAKIHYPLFNDKGAYVLGAIGWIPSMAAHEYILQLYPQLDQEERDALISGISKNVLPIQNPFVKDFDYNYQKLIKPGDNSTPEMLRMRMDLLSKLEPITSPGPVQQQIKDAIKVFKSRL